MNISLRSMRLHLLGFGVAILCAPLLLIGCSHSADPLPSAPDIALAQVRPPQPSSQPATQPTALLLGTSRQGRPIHAHRFGTAEPIVLIFAGIHGNEPTSWYVAEHLIDHLRAVPECIPATTSVIIIPRANPDGCAINRRANSRGVDLNRNFPASNWKATHPGASYTGPAPASEPETAALIALIDSLHPVRIISIHSITHGRQCNNFDGPGQSVAKAMSHFNQYPVRGNIGYDTPGSFGTWAGIDRQIPTVTLELPHDQSGESAWLANREALLAAIRGAPSDGPI
jgi:protein MpaA